MNQIESISMNRILNSSLFFLFALVSEAAFSVCAIVKSPYMVKVTDSGESQGLEITSFSNYDGVELKRVILIGEKCKDAPELSLIRRNKEYMTAYLNKVSVNMIDCEVSAVYFNDVVSCFDGGGLKSVRDYLEKYEKPNSCQEGMLTFDFDKIDLYVAMQLFAGFDAYALEMDKSIEDVVSIKIDECTEWKEAVKRVAKSNGLKVSFKNKTLSVWR